MRPTLKLLDDALAERIVAEAHTVLARVGVACEAPEVVELLIEHGAGFDAVKGRVLIPELLVERALAVVPERFGLYDLEGRQTHDLGGSRVHFTPGSSATWLLDGATGETRRPATADCVRFARLTAALPRLHAQSTAMIPDDVDPRIADSYRLLLCLTHCAKPVVTGTFTADGLAVMRDLLIAVRGDAAALAARPLAIFTCCPTSPLRWTAEGACDLVACARSRIPVEIDPVPLSGFMAPVTLVGTLVQLTAEVLSGVVISQLAAPGAPVLFGAAPAIFDIRYETSPMSAVESSMLTVAASEIGHRLGMPTQGYIALSDAKVLDAQAGLETSFGATLAALAGVNSVSGPGMLDFVNCQSLEKLVVDHEICGMVERLVAGIEPREDFPAAPLLEELLADKHLLIADHTRRHLRREITFPGPVIDRTSRDRWHEEGGRTLGQRAAEEVERAVESAEPCRLAPEVRAELEARMESEARRVGMDRLPAAEP